MAPAPRSGRVVRQLHFRFQFPAESLFIQIREFIGKLFRPDQFTVSINAFRAAPAVFPGRDQQCVAAAQIRFVHIADNEIRIVPAVFQIFAGEKQPHTAVQQQTHRLGIRNIRRIQRFDPCTQIGLSPDRQPAPEQFLIHQSMADGLQRGDIFRRTEIDRDPEPGFPTFGDFFQFAVDPGSLPGIGVFGKHKKIKVIVEPAPFGRMADSPFPAAVTAAEHHGTQFRQLKRIDLRRHCRQKMIQHRFHIRICRHGVAGRSHCGSSWGVQGRRSPGWAPRTNNRFARLTNTVCQILPTVRL